MTVEEQDYLDVRHQVPIIRVERPFTFAQTPTTRTEIVDCLIEWGDFVQSMVLLL